MNDEIDRHVSCRYGLAGHEHEYVVIIDGFDHKRFIPQSIADALQEALPQTTVLNRGTRLEVMTGQQALETPILQSIYKTFSERPWLEDM